MATKKKPAAQSIETKVQAAKDDAVVKVAAELKADGVVAKLAAANVEIQKTLAHVGGVVTAELEQLDTVRRAIELKKGELATLYGIETAAVDLDEVKAQAAAVREQIEAEREQWKKDEEEGDANIIKRRKRDEDEYAYGMGMKRRAEQDAHTAKMTAAEGKLSEREAVVRAAEKELADLRAQVANIPSLLEAERKKVAGAVAGELKSKHDFEAQLAKKDADNAKAVFDSQLAAALAANAALTARNANLEKELNQVRQDAKDIATKALEAGSRPTVFQVPAAVAETAPAGRNGR
jgi:hypothetical protein